MNKSAATDPPEKPGEEPTLRETSATLRDAATEGIRKDAPSITVPDHELLHRIGRGSYGEVWLARNVMGFYRAVKIVYRATFEHARPFDREFNGIKKFEPISRSHDGLVDVLQVGRTDQYFYYVMELADDVTTGQEIDPAHYTPRTLRSAASERGRMGFEDCVQIGLSLTQALGHMHKHGLIHRDIKPANIIFVHGQAKLADIGLVAEQSEAKSFVGTEGFIPPEGPGAPHADIYSLGKVLYEIATGKDRHEFPTLPTLLGEADSDTHLLELNSVFLKACQNDLKQRYQTCEAMRGDLHLLQSGKSVKQAQAVERRLALLTKASIAAITVTLLTLLGFYYSREQARRETELRKRAEFGEMSARQNLYVADINLAHQALESGNRGHAIELLKRHVPKPDDDDRRGFEWRYLWKLCQGEEVHTFTAGGYPVCSSVFSTDGRLVATASFDNQVRIYDVATTRMITNVPGAFRRYMSPVLSFSPDGRYLAIAGNERVFVRETAGWSLVHEIDDPSLASVFDPPQINVTFSPDGKSLATVGDKGQVVLWATDTWERKRTFDLPTGGPPLGFSPNGRCLVVANAAELLVIDLDTLERRNLRSDLVSIDSLAVSSKWVAAGSYVRGEVRIWNLETGAEAVAFRPHPTFVFALTFSKDERMLVTGGGDQIIRFWDASALDNPALLRTGRQLLSSLPRMGSLAGHLHEVWSVNLSPDARLLVSSSKDGTAKLWRTDGKSDERSLTSTWRPFGFSRDGAHLLTLNSNQTLRLWDMATRTEQNSVAFQMTSTNIAARAISRDGATLALGLTDGSLEVWSLRTRERLTKMKALANEEIANILLSPTCKLVAADFKPRDSTTRAGRRPRIATRIWNLDSQQEPVLLENSEGALAFSPDERFCLARGADYTVDVWDLKSRRKIATLSGHKWRVHAAVYSPNSRVIITSSWDNTVRVWDAATWTERTIFKGYMGGVGPAFFSPDGKTLFTGCADDSIKLWNFATGQELLSLRVAPLDAFWFLLSPDGNTLALGSSFLPTDSGAVHLIQPPSLTEIDAVERSRATEK